MGLEVQLFGAETLVMVLACLNYLRMAVRLLTVHTASSG
jgi:hypothetical protein